MNTPQSEIRNPKSVLTTSRLFTATLFLALFVMATREIADPDFWWHLRAGQYIVETQTIPRADIFSFTNAGKPWVAHEWLSQIFIYAIFSFGGFPALILAFAFLITLAFAFVYAGCEGKPYVAAFVLLLAALASAPTWGVRPQMFSLLLTSVFLFVLDKSVIASERGERSNRRVPTWGLLRRFAPRNDAIGIWLLVPLMLLWVNLHSGYALGIALIAIYLVGGIISQNFFSPALSRSRAPLLSRSPSPLLLVLIACLLVVPLNPNGATLYIYPFETLTSRAMQTYIQEWFSPDFHLPEFQAFAILLIATFASFALARPRANATNTILLAGFAYAALRSARHIPLFALAAAPILAANVWGWLAARNWSKPFVPRAQTPRVAIALNWLILLVLIGAGAARVASVAANQAVVERAKFPAAAVDFLQKNNLTAPLYNAYGWGGYLIWRGYPVTRVFIDGRADVYGDQFIEEFLRTYRGGANWRAQLDRYGVRLVLVEPDAPIVAQLLQGSEWRRIYADERAVIYEKK